MAYSYKGAISFGLVYIPITLSACIKENDIGFNMIDKKTMSRIKYKKTCVDCNEKEVKNENIVKGYQYEKDKYVIFDDKDFEKIKSPKDKNITIERFVNLNEVDPVYFDKSYYVNPTGADKAFLVLLSAMEKQKKAGIAKTVLGTKETVILIRADHGNMIVNTLFFYDEVQAAPAYKKATITKQELELAKTLINQMSGKFEPENYKDEYSEKVRRAIKAKISGNKIVTSHDEPAPAKVINIMEALKKEFERKQNTKNSLKEQKGGELMALGLYNKKRDFSKTNEPKGKVESTKSSLRFVVQYHEARAKHYDFRLEHKGVLVSFAIPKGLSQKPSDKRLAIHVEDHPTSYIDFHGTISKGNYGAGTVEIWDKGTYTTDINLSKGLKAGNFKVTLSGKKLDGTWNFARMDEKNWIAVKCKQNKKTKNPFEKVDVQLATLVKNVPEGKDWIYEIKYDGYRTIAFCEYGKTKLISRNGIDFSKKFESILPSLCELSQDHSFVLDGETVVFDENGRSNFSGLQSEIKKKGNSFSYVVFDILALDGEDLRDKKLLERKEILKKLIKNAKNNVIFSDFTKKEGQKTYNAAKKLGLEGIVAKDINSQYLGVRNLDWQKIKCRQSSEFVIGGFMTTDENKDLSSILVGVYDDKKLKFVGKVGTGFDVSQRKELNKKFCQIASKKCPFENEIDIDTSKNIVWIKPKLVAQIEYAEITPSGSLRQPSFLGLRVDKEPKDCVWEKQND